MFEQLLTQTQTANQQKLVNKFIEKGFKITRKADIEKLIDLTAEFLVANNLPAVQLCVNFIQSFGFLYDEKGKYYPTWGYMEQFYYLAYYISDDSAQKSLRKTFFEKTHEMELQGLIAEDAGKHSLEYVENHHKAMIEKRLKLILSDDFLKESKKYFFAETTKKEKYYWGLHLLYKYLMRLFYTAEIIENQQELLNEIKNHIAQLNELYRAINKIG